MNGINKLILPTTILIGVFILGSFYYASESNKQKSIERQLEMKIAEDRRLEEKVDKQKYAESLIRSDCVTQATKAAVELYKDSCTSDSYCNYKEGMYNVNQYNTGYNTCLQSYGLK